MHAAMMSHGPTLVRGSTSLPPRYEFATTFEYSTTRSLQIECGDPALQRLNAV
jgi:hypothetical protein